MVFGRLFENEVSTLGLFLKWTVGFASASVAKRMQKMVKIALRISSSPIKKFIPDERDL